MLVKEIMNPNPVCALPDTSLREAAEMMVEHDCGSIPVVDNPDTAGPLLGVVTDRDIVCRTIAAGKNPLSLKVADCMTGGAASVHPDDDIEICFRKMESHQVRRLPVVDDQGHVCGIVTQAHLAKNASPTKVGAYLQRISEEPVSAGRS